MARRKPNTGTIRRKAGRDLPWETAFPLGNGQHRYNSFATREEATAHLDQLTEERDNKDIKRDIAMGSTRFDAFGTMWLGIKKGRVKETTFNTYYYMVDLAIGQWAARRMDEIFRPHADMLMSYFANQDFKDLDQLRGVLSQLFNYAVEIDAIRKNPFKKVQSPMIEHRQTVALTQAQRTRMLEAAAEHDPHSLLPMWHLLSRVGLRRGEALGLRWQDVDLENGIIHIRQQYACVYGTLKKSTPKTKQSVRDIVLPEDLTELLKQQRDRVRLLRLRAGEWNDLDLVFPEENGNPIRIHRLQAAFDRLKKAAKLPKGITIHGLRHTAQYLMEQNHVPLSSRQAIMGHSTATMATHYANHADMDALRAAAKKMG